MNSELEGVLKKLQNKEEIVEKLQEMVDVLTTERNHCEVEVQSQRTLVNDLRAEFDQLCADVKVNNQRLNEKSAELDQLQREFDMRLKTSSNEVDVLKTLVAEQKQLLIDSYQENELDINQKIKEVNDYQNQVEQMEDELVELRKKNSQNQENFQADLAAEVEKLKSLLEENQNLLEDHKEELLHKQETIDSLNNQIIDLYKTMEENSNKIIEKEDELQNLQENNDAKQKEIRNLHEKVSDCNKAISDLRRQLVEQTQENEFLAQKTPTKDPKTEQKIEDLEREVKLLEVKNKEQLDKMKKYAANLKKKQAQCSELEEKLASAGDADPSAVNELKAKVIQYEEQLNLVKRENSKLNSGLQKTASDESEGIIEQKNREICEKCHEIEIKNQEIGEMNREIDGKAQEIQSLSQQLQEILTRNDQMEETLFDFRAQIQKLETDKMKLSEAANALGEVSRELEKIKKEKDEIVEKFNGEKAEEKKKVS